MDTTMDPVRQLVRNTLAERHLNMSNVSKRLGKNHAYLHQFLDRGIPAQLPELVREKLAMILQVPESQLKGTGTPVRGSGPARAVRDSAPVAGDRIPVLGAGQAGPDGWLPWNGEIVDYVFRPPHVAGATQAYAVYVSGSSMEPRYYAGDVVYVHPGKPVTNGSFVLVQVRPEAEGETPRAFMKRLVRRTASKVTFEQFNPPREIDIKASDILSIHRIVGSAESGGS
jgi:phage repressor protein C with HTH and peptisase S24 domain